MLDTLLEDQRSAWDMQPDGAYVQRQPQDDSVRSSQLLQIEQAENRLKSKKRRKQQRLGAKRSRENT